MLSQRNSFLQAVKLEAPDQVLQQQRGSLLKGNLLVNEPYVGGFSGLKPLESQHTE